MADGVRALSRYTALALESLLESADADRPRFMDLQTPIRKFMGDNPDQTYRRATITGNGTYVVEGSMGGALAMEVAVYGGGGFMTGGRRLVGAIDDSTMDVTEDGCYEVMLSPDASGPNAIRLEAGASSVLVRTYFTDLDVRLRHQMPAIRRESATPPAPLPSEQWIEDHLALAGLFVSGSLGWWMNLKAEQASTSLNEFPPMRDDGDLLTPANVRYRSGYWRLAPEEAWVIDISTDGRADYWSAVLMSVWGETVDWRERPAVVNNATAVPEPDGTVRIVVAHRDPGVPNWLDTGGHPEGSVALRWFRSDDDLPEVMTAVVDVSDLAG